MKKQGNSYQRIVNQVLDHAKEHLSEPIALESLARLSGFSKKHIQRAFQAILGETVLTHLTRLRLEKAKLMLTQTDLPVTEIAFETGHSSHTYFGSVFRSKTGMTPSAFRESSRQGKTGSSHQDTQFDSREWFNDPLTTGTLGPEWNIQEGEWKADQRGLYGKDLGMAVVNFRKTLPENFRLKFEFRFESRRDLPPSDLVVALHDEERHTSYCSFAVGRTENNAAEIDAFGARKRWNPEGRIVPDTWQAMEIELKNETVSLALDGKGLCRFRDPFPPPYSSRCRLSISTWRSAFRLRNVVIEDLGFSTFMSTVGRGDTLYVLGQYDKAADFYLRLSQTGDLSIDTMELSYKIGMCSLQQGAYEDARLWFDKLATLRLGNFWAQQARLGMVETDRLQGRWDEFKQGAGALWSHEILSHEVRALCERAARNLESRAFPERAADVLQFVFDREPPSQTGRVVIGTRLAQVCTTLHQWDRAEEILVELIESPYSTIAGLHVLMELYAQVGRAEESDRIIAKIRERTGCLTDLYDCAVYEALNLRTLGKFKEALARLDEIAHEYAPVVKRNAHALLQQSLLATMLGDLKKARKALDRAAEVMPASGSHLERSGSIIAYLPHLVAGKFELAAGIFPTDPGPATTVDANAAIRQIKGGILHELAGDARASSRLFDDAAKRFAYPYINFYGGLARTLSSDGEDDLDQMPADAFIRCEMFYLVGLLNEKRGNARRARELFQMAVNEDPRNYAPAYLAKQKLAGKS